MAAEYDWSRFVKRININASADQLYKAWVTRAGIESWFLRMGEFSEANGSLLPNDTPVQKGNKYKWRWYGYSDDTAEYGEIIEANGKDMLVFTFATQMKVRIKIKTEEGETLVELDQYDIPVDEKGKTNFHIGCMEGWIFYMANLKSIMEGGIDLRNKNEKLKKVINS
jgi:uncharacterized protein YndB with AHSA1/START domain